MKTKNPNKQIEQLKKQRTKLRRASTIAQKKYEAQQKKINSLENNYENNPRVQELDKEIEELEKRKNEIREELRKIKNETRTPTSEEYRERDYLHRENTNANEQLKTVEKRINALTNLQGQATTKEQAHALLRNTIGKIGMLYDDSEKYGRTKDGKFYEKQNHPNGVVVYHAKADNYDGYSAQSTNRYFAFKGGDLIGFWVKEKSRHPGDWISTHECWVGVKHLTKDNELKNKETQVNYSGVEREIETPLSYHEWNAKLKELAPEEQPTAIVFSEENLKVLDQR